MSLPSTTRSPAVACFGEGLVVLVQERPGPLEDALTFRRSIGGAEVNVAIALATDGVASAIVTRVGDEGFGRHLVSSVADCGVDVSAVLTDASRPTGMYVKEVGGAGDRATDLGPGVSRMHYYRTGSASSALSPADLDSPAVARVLDDAAIVHVTGITPSLSPSALAATRALFDRRRPGQLISFDLNWRPALWEGRRDQARETLAPFVAGADIAFLGAPEAREVFGTGDPDELRRLFPQPEWLAIKNDANAATGFEREVRVDAAALTADVVETIGAGDAFAAGLLAARLAGAGLGEALAAAHRSAIRALGSVGDHIGFSTPAAGIS